jgi:hypothetical protein
VTASLQESSWGALLARGGLAAALLAAVCTMVYALDGDFELTVARLVDGLYQLRGGDRGAELALVAKGASREDADRYVRALADGFVRCLMNELKSYSAQQEESFSQRLRTVQASLDRQGAASVLQDLLMLARAQSGSGDACAVDELKRSGFTMDALN